MQQQQQQQGQQQPQTNGVHAPIHAVLRQQRLQAADIHHGHQDP